MRSIAHLPLIALALFMVTPAFALGAGNVCIKGTPKPVDPLAPSLRPEPTARCPYGLDELAKRLTALLVDKQSPDSVETVEKALAIPEMTTAFDDPRDAEYDMDVTGKGGWKLRIFVVEAFYPTNKGPARFVPGLRPKRLYKVTDASLRVQLTLDDLPKTVQCTPDATMLRNILAKAGWKEIWIRPLVTDGGRPDPSTTFRYENKSIVLPTACKNGEQGIFLEQKPTELPPASSETLHHQTRTEFGLFSAANNTLNGQ